MSNKTDDALSVLSDIITKQDCEIKALQTQLEAVNYELVNRIAELAEATVKLQQANEEIERLKLGVTLAASLPAATIVNLQAKLARYEAGVEVEGITEVWQSWGEPSTTVSADLPYGSFSDNQRVKVLVMKEGV